MSICVSWSTEHGCTRCRNRRECNELGLSPFDDATDEEVNALVDDGVLPEYHGRGSMPPLPFYTVQRCRKDDMLYGPIHFSSDGYRTFCGQQTDENWWILTNDASGVATCPKCKKMNLPNNPEYARPNTSREWL